VSFQERRVRYLTKEKRREQLVGAVEKVVAGGRYISPSLADEWRPT